MFCQHPTFKHLNEGLEKPAETTRKFHFKDSYKYVCLGWTVPPLRNQKEREGKRLNVAQHAASWVHEAQKWSGCSLCWPFPLRATLWSLCFPWGSAHDHKFGQRFFSLPSNISFHLQPQGWALAFPSEPGYKDLGPLGLTQQALLSITAWPSLLPFTPRSWTHRCQPGNNLQTIEAWKPGLDTLLATYLLLLAAVEA